MLVTLINLRHCLGLGGDYVVDPAQPGHCAQLPDHPALQLQLGFLQIIRNNVHHYNTALYLISITGYNITLANSEPQLRLLLYVKLTGYLESR